MGVAFKAAAVALLAANVAAAAWRAPARPAEALPSPERAREQLAPLSEAGLAQARSLRAREVARCVALSGMGASGRDEALSALSKSSQAVSFEQARAQRWEAVGPGGVDGPFGSLAQARAKARELGKGWSAREAQSAPTYEVRLGPWLRKDVEALGKIAKSWGAREAAECDQRQWEQWSQAKERRP